jgi:hypothetical protein
MTTLEMLFAGYCLATGILLGWMWSSAPLKRRVLELETRLKWETALKMAAELDLQRAKAKVEKLTPSQEKVLKKKG